MFIKALASFCMLLGRNLEGKGQYECCAVINKSISPAVLTVFTDTTSPPPSSPPRHSCGIAQAKILPSFHAVELIVIYGIPKCMWSFLELPSSLFFLLMCFICCGRAESSALRRPLCFCWGTVLSPQSETSALCRDVKSSETVRWIQLKPTLLPSSLWIWIVECLVITQGGRCVSLSMSVRVCVCVLYCVPFEGKCGIVLLMYLRLSTTKASWHLPADV